MKKRVISTLLIVLVFALMLTGCGKKTTPGLSYDASEYMTLGQYTGLTVTITPEEVTDEAILEYLYATEEYKAELEENTVTFDEETYEPVQLGDSVSFYLCNSDGSFGKTHYTVVAGEDTDFFPKEFTSKLVNVPVGMDGIPAIVFKYPDPYYIKKTLSGTQGAFIPYVTSISRITYPDLEDTAMADYYINKWFGESLKITTFSDYKAYVTDILKVEYKDKATEDKSAFMWTAIYDKTEYSTLPVDEVENKYEEYDAMIDTQAAMNSADKEYIASYTYGFEVDKYDEWLRGSAEDAVLQEMVYYMIADIEKISISERDYEQYVSELIVEGEYYTEQEMLDDLYTTKEAIIDTMLFNKVTEYLMERNTFVYSY